MLRRFPIFQLRKKSLARGTILALGSLWASFRLSGFPEVHICLWLIAPMLIATGIVVELSRSHISSQHAMPACKIGESGF